MKNEEHLKIKLTKNLLRNALLQLITEKGQLSVKNICERAGVHRSTFYLHYKSPEELLDKIGNDFIKRTTLMIEPQKELKDIRKLILEYLKEVKQNKELLYVLLVSEEGAVFRTKVSSQITKLFPEKYLSKAYGNEKEYAIAYMVSGCMELQARWLTNQFDLSENDMADLILRLTTGLMK